MMSSIKLNRDFLKEHRIAFLRENLPKSRFSLFKGTLRKSEKSGEIPHKSGKGSVWMFKFH